jgi:hypothetical protein
VIFIEFMPPYLAIQNRLLAILILSLGIFGQRPCSSSASFHVGFGLNPAGHQATYDFLGVARHTCWPTPPAASDGLGADGLEHVGGDGEPEKEPGEEQPPPAHPRLEEVEVVAKDVAPHYPG